MHNAAFRYQRLDIVYLAFRLRSEGIAKALDGLREIGFLGLNVTIPHKKRVMEHLDGIDHVASEIGAVNTILNREGSLIGYNTDWLGAIEALRGSGFDPGPRGKALIIGAGDAARAVGYSLAKAGMGLFITNRNRERGADLARDLKGFSDTLSVEREGLKDIIPEVTLIVNCTPVGMIGFPDGSPIDPELIRSDMTVMDIVYDPMDTTLLRIAKERGARVVHGHRMLIGQGIRSYEIWTGRKAPVDVMEKAVLDHLKGV
jgi:shikimate dehydrogenase